MLRTTIFLIAAVLIIPAGHAVGQATPDNLPRLVERNLSGPRFGITYVGMKRDLRERLPEGTFHRIVSQFGWHFEHQITPEGGGPQFVLQFVPMLAGVEHGRITPNVTFAMGVRLLGGFEGGLGPNLQLPTNLESASVTSSALLLAVGKTLDYGGVSIPFNITYAINPNGNRVSFVIGYAIQRTRSRRIGRP